MFSFRGLGFVAQAVRTWTGIHLILEIQISLMSLRTKATRAPEE